VVRYIAHDAVLERAACVVCHGGMGITQKALAAGVPVVASRSDAISSRRHGASKSPALACGYLPASSAPSASLMPLTVRSRDGRALRGVSRAFLAAGGARAAAEALHALTDRPDLADYAAAKQRSPAPARRRRTRPHTGRSRG